MPPQIGDDVGSLVTLDTLGLKDPFMTYEEFSVVRERADALVAGLGRALAVWRWGFVSQTAYNSLRSTYCPGKSNDVVITTLKDDGTFANFDAVIIWPEESVPRSDKTLDFVVEFFLIVEL